MKYLFILVFINLFNFASAENNYYKSNFEKKDLLNLKKKWIYKSKSEYILDKLEVLDLSWKKKENSPNEQLDNYNSKIEELEEDLKVKNK